MKKRMIALMLAGIMVLSVTACGGGGASSKNQNNQDDGESKQVGVEVTEDMQSAPPEDAPVGGQVVVAISPGTLSPDMYLSLIHISEPTRLIPLSRMPSSA